MTEPHTNIDAQIAPSRSIPERITVPMLLFSGSLCLMLALSWTLLLPRFTRVHVEGEAMSPYEVSKRVRSLNAELTAMAEKRIKLVLPLHDVTYEALKAEKLGRRSVGDLRFVLQQAAARTGEAGAVSFMSMKLSTRTGVASVSGDVSGVGPRSMTVLASYIEELEKDPRVTGLVRPVFTRTMDAQSNIHSPFSISFTLTR